MYRTIIADDELPVCLLLEKMIDWEALNIKIIGIYTDGEEAYQAIVSKHPDIVITDIKMPGMSGLDIVRNCINNKIDVMFLLVSGHAEFEYAHMAIAYGVENYLLKPINGKELEENIIAVCNKLDLKCQQDQDIADMKNRIDVSEEALAKSFFRNYLQNPEIIKQRSMSEINNEYFLNLSDGYFQLFILKPTSRVQFTNQQIILLLKQIEVYGVRELSLYFDKIISACTDLEVYFLVNGLKSQNSTNAIKVVFNRLSSVLYEYCDITFAMSSSATHLSLLETKEAEICLLLRYNKGVNHWYGSSELEGMTDSIDYRKHLTQLSGNINILNPDGIDRFFQCMEDCCRSEKINPVQLPQMTEDIQHTWMESFDKLGEELDRNLVVEMGTLLRRADNFAGLFSEMSRLIKGSLRNVMDKREFDNSRVVTMAKDYISKHLKEKIVLEDIAAIVYMNSTYFSTLFKKETGENFSDYLVNRRIDRAKELLSSMDLSIQQVGEAVGYGNARYFSKVFFKVVGVSPSDYRKYAKYF